MADVYIVIYNKQDAYGFGKPLRVLWVADVNIARMVCSDERTCGSSHFLGWTYVGEQKVKWQRDNGMYDEVLEDLGLQKVREGDELRLVAKSVATTP